MLENIEKIDEKKVGKNIEKASQCILDGMLVVMPTETVYGLAADATNKEAVSKIFKAKHRPEDNPLIVHVCDINMLNKVAKNITVLERKIIDTFFPGPISIILEKSDIIPSNVSAGLNTIAVRMPNNKLCLEFIKKCNRPLAAPSANVSTRPSGTIVTDIYDELNESVSYFIDDGQSSIGIESTVVKVNEDEIIILRPGKITKEDLMKICPNVIIDDKVMNKPKDNEKVLSPRNETQTLCSNWRKMHTCI